MTGAGELRLTVFAAVYLTMALAEQIWPRRAQRREPTLPHHVRNVVLSATGSLLAGLMALAGSIVPALVAWRVYNAGGGLLGALDAPFVAAVTVTVIALDALVWAQHVVFHKVPLLWRLHKVHHTDVDFDASTGIRFHPIEIGLSLLIKSAAVWLLGAPPEGVLLFEMLLNATALFNHANLALPEPVDRLLRLFIVTPDMHRVHHSVWRDETDSNFGFNLPWWDRMFGTYRAQPRDGHDKMVIGVPTHQERPVTLAELLALPFVEDDRSEDAGGPQHS